MLLTPLLLATGAPQDVRLAVEIDPGAIERPPECPVLARLDVADLPPGTDLDAAPVWRGRLRGEEPDRLVQVRVLREGERAAAVELAFLARGLEAGRALERELVLEPDVERSGRFELVEEDGARELRRSGVPLWRHELARDPERHEETFRPYTHLFGPDGRRLTKGPGGEYPHHRGVFCGWMRTRVGEATHDFWSIPAPPRPHQEHRGWDASAEWVGPVLVRVAALTDWVAADGTVVVRERREWDTWRYEVALGVKHVLLDHRVTLAAAGGEPVELEGDPAHAGFQVRLVESVAHPHCRYRLSAEAVTEGDDDWHDASWAAAEFSVGLLNFYEVLFHDHPSNPRPTVFNTRAYGHFGPSFRTTLRPGEPLELRYGLRIGRPSGLPDPAQEHASWLHPVEVRPLEVR